MFACLHSRRSFDYDPTAVSSLLSILRALRYVGLACFCQTTDAVVSRARHENTKPCPKQFFRAYQSSRTPQRSRLSLGFSSRPPADLDRLVLVSSTFRYATGFRTALSWPWGSVTVSSDLDINSPLALALPLITSKIHSAG